jgi:sporulation protein YlmC with PRC-barrel domain
MKPDGPIKLVSQLLDLPIIDSEGKHCGIVDDVELAGEAPKAMKIKALLVGPGAYGDRLPRWMMSLVRMTAGDRVVRVPWSKVGTIRSAVQLQVAGRTLGLQRSEDRVKRWIPRKGAF